MKSQNQNKKGLKSLITFMMVSAILSTCKKHESVFITDDNDIICKSCPANCSICYPSLQGITCGYCNEGFYLTPFKKECRACTDNCLKCIGSKLTTCKTPKLGYYFNKSDSSIKKCKMEGCAHCPTSDTCVAC